MKRDLDLIRLILLEVEEGDSFPLDTYTMAQILYHKNLLIEANLVYGKTLYGEDRILAVVIDRLTWEGHEFLDTIRHPAVWQQTKATVNKFGSAPIVVIKEIAIHVARTTINTFTDGGSYVGGNVTTGDSFIGRDKM